MEKTLYEVTIIEKRKHNGDYSAGGKPILTSWRVIEIMPPDINISPIMNLLEIQRKEALKHCEIIEFRSRRYQLQTTWENMPKPPCILDLEATENTLHNETCKTWHTIK